MDVYKGPFKPNGFVEGDQIEIVSSISYFASSLVGQVFTLRESYVFEDALVFGEDGYNGEGFFYRRVNSKSKPKLKGIASWLNERDM